METSLVPQYDNHWYKQQGVYRTLLSQAAMATLLHMTGINRKECCVTGVRIVQCITLSRTAYRNVIVFPVPLWPPCRVSYDRRYK